MKKLESLESSNHPFAIELLALCKKYNADFSIDNRWDEGAYALEDKIIVTLDPVYDDDILVSVTEIEIITI